MKVYAGERGRERVSFKKPVLHSRGELIGREDSGATPDEERRVPSYILQTLSTWM